MASQSPWAIVIWVMFRLTACLKETPRPEEIPEQIQLLKITREVIIGIGRPKRILEWKKNIFHAALVQGKAI